MDRCAVERAGKLTSTFGELRLHGIIERISHAIVTNSRQSASASPYSSPDLRPLLRPNSPDHAGRAAIPSALRAAFDRLESKSTPAAKRSGFRLNLTHSNYNFSARTLETRVSESRVVNKSSCPVLIISDLSAL